MLDYNQPIDRARPEPSQQRPQAGFNALQLANLLWRRKIAIAAAALLGATLAVTIGKSVTPRYTATAQLYVDPRELQLVDRELTPRAQDVSGMSMVVESQARLITSNSVLLKVIQQAGLDKDPEFGGGGDGKSLMSSLLGLIGLQTGAPSAAENKEVQLAALEALNRHITIRKTEKSFIVDVEVWSTDPAKAAMLANTLTSAYLAESRNSQASAARRATNDLSGRLKELRDRLRNAETALATYKAQNNFVGTQDALISDQQLSASNQRLSAARAATMDAQARLDQIEASRRTAADAGANSEALQSPTIANLRAQYADARKKYAEQAGELGPRHPALRQTEKQVEDLKRTINEEIDRFAQSAKNDLTRARDYEASLNRALEAQKRQSVQLSQAAVRLRELEREADASRDVYQSFLKRSRETEEQETLNTSAARVIGEATVPQRRSFPPAMSLFAMIGFIFGALAASGWFVAAELLFAGVTAPAPAPARRERTPAPGRARTPETSRTPEASRPQQVLRTPEVVEAPPELAAPPLQPSMVEKPLIEKPLIARLQEADVIHTLGAILATGGGVDLTRLGWPTLRPGFPLTTLLNAWRDMRTAVARRAGGKAMPVIALVGTGEITGRSVSALNFALAAARDGAHVLMIDADHQAHALSNKVSRPGKSEPSRLGWLSIGSKAAREIKTVNGISVLPAAGGDAGKASEAIRKAIAQARAAGGYDLVILDGPAMPLSASSLKLLDDTDALVAVLPTSLDINDSLEEILTALGRAERKLVGVVLDELTPAAQTRQRGRQYA